MRFTLFFNDALYAVEFLLAYIIMVAYGDFVSRAYEAF